MYVNQHETSDFFRSALVYEGSVTPRIITRVLIIFVYACFISVVNFVYPPFYLSIGPFEYAGFMLAVILVFRINCGYDRWWEARKLWGSIVNCSRNLATIAVSYIDQASAEDVLRIKRYIVAIPYLIKNQLRHERSMLEVASLLDEDDFKKIETGDNRPLILSTMLAQAFSVFKQKNQIDPMSFLKAEEQRESIIDCQGACERILKTPMPYVTVIKSRRFILIFLLALPCALIDVTMVLTPLITSLVAYAIFSVDQIGTELQNPFSMDSLSHLPLDDICKKIEADVFELTCP